MAAPWDTLGKAANLVQLLGLDAFTLITIIIRLGLLLRNIEIECRKLEERVRWLRWIMTQQQQHLVMEHLVNSAFRDAQDLVTSYNKSTLFLRIWRGRSMAIQFQDLYNKINYYCHLILIVQANPPPPLAVRGEVNDEDVSPSTGYSTDVEISSAPPDDTHIVDVS